MSELDNAQILGGVVVTIGTNDTNLRAGIANAKQVVAAAESELTCVIPLEIGPAGAAIGELRDRIGDIQSAVTPIIIPVRLDTTGLQAQVAQVSQLALPAPNGGNVPMLPGPSAGWGNVPMLASPSSNQYLAAPGAQAALPGPNQAKWVESRIVPQNTELATSAQGELVAGGGGGGPIVPNGPDTVFIPGGGESDDEEEGGGGKKNPYAGVLKAHMAVMGAKAAVDLTSATASAGQAAWNFIPDWAGGAALRDPNVANQQKIIDAGRASVRSVPIVGALADQVGGYIQGMYSRAGNLIAGNGFNSDYELAAKTDAETAIIDAKSARMETIGKDQQTFNEHADQIGQSARDEVATSGMTATQRAAYGANEELTTFNKNAEAERVKEFGAPESQNTIDTRRALQARAAQTQFADTAAGQLADREAASSNQVIGEAADVGLLRAGGHNLAAGRSDITNRTSAEVDRLQNQIIALEDKGAGSDQIREVGSRIQTVSAAGQKNLQAYDLVAKRQGDEIVTHSQSEVRQSQDHIAFNRDAAAEEGIHDAYRPRIDEATRNFGADSDQTKSLKAEEAQKIDEQRAQSAVNNNRIIASADAEAAASKLRVARDFNAAELAQYDANAKAKIEALKQAGASAKAIVAAQAATVAGHNQLVAGQGDQAAMAGISFQARSDEAVARGRGEDQLAGVIGEIATMKEELIAPHDASLDPQIRQT